MENKKEINKPLSVILKEAEQGIINEINKYNLPPYLLELILKNIYAEVATLAHQAYEKDMSDYMLNSVQMVSDEDAETEKKNLN